MSFSNSTEPLLRTKQTALDVQDLQGLLRIYWQVGNKTIFSGFYTRIDQVFILWGLINALIFSTAQFFPLSWHLQAIFWSTLSVVGLGGMVILVHYWVRVEKVVWVVYAWILLMLSGVILTDFSIFLGWGEVLIRLCPLWLVLNALGYFCTGIGLQSRTFMFTGLIHLLSIGILPYVGGWQFLTTGIVIVVSLLLLAEMQWDMRSPIDSDVLTSEQKEFNRKQQHLRQLSA